MARALRGICGASWCAGFGTGSPGADLQRPADLGCADPVFDVHDPLHPKEVAYLNPAVGSGSSMSHDSSTTYTRYLPRSGQVWFGSAVNGLNVAELAPSLRPLKGGRWTVPAPGVVTDVNKGYDLASLLARKGIDWHCTAGVRTSR